MMVNFTPRDLRDLSVANHGARSHSIQAKIKVMAKEGTFKSMTLWGIWDALCTELGVENQILHEHKVATSRGDRRAPRSPAADGRHRAQAWFADDW
jgi:hypothetical protein